MRRTKVPFGLQAAGELRVQKIGGVISGHGQAAKQNAVAGLAVKFAVATDPDPNVVEMNREGVRYVQETEKDEDGVEVGYDPIFGPSNPVDPEDCRDTNTFFVAWGTCGGS